MKKKLSIVIVAVLLLIVLSVTLISCNSEMDYVEKLVDKGYKYVYISVSTWEREDGLTTSISANYDGGYMLPWIYEVQRGGYVYIFNTKDEAKNCYDNGYYCYYYSVSNESIPNFTAKVKGNVVFYGTEQFLKDLGA